MLEACGLKGHRIGGAQISPKHANFIENADGATTADALALMAEARRRAHEQYGVRARARGRVPRRARAARAVGGTAPATNSEAMPARVRFPRSIARVDTLAPTLQNVGRGASARVARASSPRRAARSRSVSPSSRSRSAVTCSRARHRSSRSTRFRFRAGRRRSRGRSARRSRRSPASLSSGSTARRSWRESTRFRRSSAQATTATSRTRCASSSSRSAPRPCCGRGPDSWLVSTRGRVMERLASSAVPRLPRIWISTKTQVRTGGQVAGAGAAAVARAAGFAGAFAPRIVSASYTNGTLVFHLRSGVELLLGDASDVKLKLAVAERVLTMLPAGSTFLDVASPADRSRGPGRRRFPHRKPLVEVEVRNSGSS